MSTPIRFISGEAALRAYMTRVQTEVLDELDRRNINATGRLKRSTTTQVQTSVVTSRGTLSALGYWVNAGSGTPPGTVVTPQELAKWAVAKGLANNDRAALKLGVLVSRKIQRFGSKQFREGGENAYRVAIERRSEDVPEVLSAFLRDIPKAMISEFKAFANAS
jgi:hypothetical protein